MGLILFKEFEVEFPIFYLGFALILSESISLEINVYAICAYKKLQL